MGLGIQNNLGADETELRGCCKDGNVNNAQIYLHVAAARNRQVS